MFTKPADVIVGGLVIAVVVGLSFPMNPWFTSTMFKHQILQLPALLLLGMVSGAWFLKPVADDFASGLAGVIFLLFTLLFWMLPRSIDLSVIYPWVNRLMLVNMYVAGWILIAALKRLPVEAVIIVSGMLAAMTIATGLTLKTYNITLCSAFTIEQQQRTGVAQIILGIAVFANTIYRFFIAHRT